MEDDSYVYKPRPDYEMLLQNRHWGSQLLNKPLPLIRNLLSWLFSGFVYFCAACAVIPLFSILWTIVRRGLPGLKWTVFTAIPAPVGVTDVPDGFGNAIMGTLMIVGVSSLVSIPLGILVGIYLAEFNQGSLFDRYLNNIVRFAQRILSSIPSIIIGVFAYGVIVFTTKKFSAFAGSFALSIIMLPIVALTTEEAMKRVPNDLRLAAASLGGNKFQVTSQIVLKSALNGITTGCLLAIARAAGETAPLIFTALNSPTWPEGLFAPAPSLPVLIFKYASSPYDVQKNLSWTAALVLLLLVLIGNIASRFFVNRRFASK
jgi:phosphate transport system permease protein